MSFQNPYASRQPTRCCCQPTSGAAAGNGKRPMAPSQTGSEGTALPGSPLMTMAVQTRFNDAARQIAWYRKQGGPQFVFQE